MKGGVPFDEAFGIPAGQRADLRDHERMAIGVILGEYEGGIFDWDRMTWRRDD